MSGSGASLEQLEQQLERAIENVRQVKIYDITWDLDILP